MTAILIILFLVIYFIPSMVGASKRNSTSIFLLNLFLGWSLIGWVIALIWATSSDDEKMVIVQNEKVSNNDITESLIKLDQLKQNGSITEEEFNIAKGKLLT